jgi:tetratricopeptide (TPR) repeat protein
MKIGIDPYTSSLAMLTASRYRFNESYASSLKSLDSSIVFSINRALELDPANDALWNDRGVLLYNLGLYDEALASFEQSIALNSGDDSTWYNKGNAYFHLNYFEQAIASYDEALALNPNN